MGDGIRDGKGRILKNTDPLFTNIAENYPSGNYTSFCNEFGVGYNPAKQILRIENMGNQTAALKQVLNKWLDERQGVTRAKLESALTNAKTGGLLHHVKNNFEKYAVKEQSAEGDESDVQANNQATASSAAGQSIPMTGNTINVTNNFGTGNGEDRKRRTDEHDAGPSHKKKANEKTMSMTTRHRKILEKSAPDILNDLKADDVLPLLLRDEVITTDDADEVKTKPTRREKVAALLDILPRRGDRAYASFLDSLNETPGSVHLYESVKECEADQEQDVPTRQGAELLTSSDQPSRGGNTQSGSILMLSASGRAWIHSNRITGQTYKVTDNKEHAW